MPLVLPFLMKKFGPMFLLEQVVPISTALLPVFEKPRQEHPSDFHAVLRNLAETLPRRGLVIIFSDLFGDRDALCKGLQVLRQRGHDVAIYHILDDDEIDFPFDGPTRFEGLEMGGEISCNPRALRNGYIQAMEKFLAEVRNRSAASQCDYQLARTSQAVDKTLVKFLVSTLQSTQRIINGTGSFPRFSTVKKSHNNANI